MLNFIDFEVFPKLWTATIINPITRTKEVFVNNPWGLRDFHYHHNKELYVGFNNRQYDDYILKAILVGIDPWVMNQWIIRKKRKGWELSTDLRKAKVNSFDCMIGFNGLKTLEAFSGMDIRETTIPFDYEGEFTPEMIEEVLKYNEHDVLATIKVFMARKSEFDSYVGLMTMFNLPMTYMSKSKAQLAAIILGARKSHHSDEFDISFPPTMRVEKYTQVLDYFRNGWNYDTKLETMIAGVPHVYGTGGIHGAIPNYIAEGEFLHVDVNSYYPSLMLRYPEYCMSRSGASVEKYREIKDDRIKFKKMKDPRANALKIVLNSTYGAMKDRFNPLFDPRSANNVCVFGQVLLTDLIERLENRCQIVQSNTDGLIVKLHDNESEVKAICKEWEERTGMGLGYDRMTKIIQKDVNNYIAVFEDGSLECKGSYIKALNNLDYDLPIVNKAIKAYFIDGVMPEKTVGDADKLIEFQKVVKLSPKYEWVEHEQCPRNKRYDQKAYRVFASKRPTDGRLLKCKMTDKGEKKDKFGNTPNQCFIDNGCMDGLGVPTHLDRQYYIDLAWKRIRDFEGGKK